MSPIRGCTDLFSVYLRDKVSEDESGYFVYLCSFQTRDCKKCQNYIKVKVLYKILLDFDWIKNKKLQGESGCLLTQNLPILQPIQNLDVLCTNNFISKLQEENHIKYIKKKKKNRKHFEIIKSEEGQNCKQV